MAKRMFIGLVGSTLLAACTSISAGQAGGGYGSAGLGTTTVEAASVQAAILATPESLVWGDAPPSLPPGAKMALIEGDPKVPGRLFTIRLKAPSGYKVPPHWHPADEHLTVISGTFRVGRGDSFDAAATTALGAGSYMVMPAKEHHYAVTEGETIVQVHAIGAWALNYVNAADDPRNAPQTAR